MSQKFMKKRTEQRIRSSLRRQLSTFGRTLSAPNSL